MALQPRRWQVVPAGMSVSRSGSSDSDSGAGDGAGGRDACGRRGVGAGGVGATPLVVVGLGFGADAGAPSSAGGFCGGVGVGAGVSSTVECLPVVQGGMERNSSKVRTRDLQHFQPDLCTGCVSSQALS